MECKDPNSLAVEHLNTHPRSLGWTMSYDRGHKEGQRTYGRERSMFRLAETGELPNISKLPNGQIWPH
jgi:hypothetical protein